MARAERGGAAPRHVSGEAGTAMAHRVAKGPWARTLCSLAAVAALVVLSVEAQAQTERKLVGNTADVVGGITALNISPPVAQSFSTGSHAQGYTLNNVQIDYNGSGTFSVEVCNVTGADLPTDTCVDFTAPGTFSAGLLTFTAPSGGVQLAAGTAYAVVLRPVPPGSVVRYVLNSRTNDDEDANSLSDWSIADEYYWHEAGNVWNADASSRSLRMNLRGYANPVATLVSNTGQTTTDSAQVGQSDNQVTQTFTTGSNAGGYQLESVDIDIADEDLEAGETFTAHIYTALCSGDRGELLYTLTSPATYADGALNRFTAPAGARLAPGSNYMVVMEGTGDDPLDFILDTTDSGAEDAGFATGWAIENGFRNENLLDADDTLKIAIRGSALGADATLVGSLEAQGLLCATLTVGFDQNRRGYLGEGDEYGDLSQDRFVLDAETYRVKSIRWAGPRGGNDGGGPRLHLTLDKDIPAAVLEDLTLRIGEHDFPLWEAGRSNSFNDESNNYRWQDPPSELRNAREGAVFGVELVSSASDATLRTLELRNVPRDGHSFPHPDYDPEFALTPEFAPGTTTGYAAEVPHLTHTITVDARTAARRATIRYFDGEGSEIGQPSGGARLQLSRGANTIDVEVTSADATTSTYTITVTRQPQVVLRYSGPHDHDDDILHMTMSGTSAEPEISGTETAVRCLGRPFLLRDEHGTTLTNVGWSLDPRIRNDGLVYQGSEMFDIGADGQVRTVVGVDYPATRTYFGGRLGVEYFRVRGTDLDSGGYTRMLVRANFLHPSTQDSEARRATNACVSAAAQEQEPLTAEFLDEPASHDGASDFTLRLSFSDDVEISPEDLLAHALSARAGTVTAVTRVDDAKDLFQVTVRPDGDGTVTVTL
ncbi:MAG: cadherin-like beta sandwich domain-containing protein, partial [Gammaproteobacteria bacterium]|nr:cadherin-like beta sandwich domain-containing protein [Gammaproteobacteria bacterium]